MTTPQLIAELKDKGFTKWQIKKRMGVSWNTVNLWSLGAFAPIPQRKRILLKMLKEPPRSKIGKFYGGKYR